jgi:hypothetical protein|tara:strand:- start:2401 stop:2592 length:192 start_codon:yes stop_codon:yes gene_type:complete
VSPASKDFSFCCLFISERRFEEFIMLYRALDQQAFARPACPVSTAIGEYSPLAQCPVKDRLLV